MKTDIEIAQEAVMEPIGKVAEKIGIGEDDLELYGKYKAKLSNELIKRVEKRPDGKLVLMTAINPTPAGEGKTTTSIGLAQAFCKMGKKAILALREPSLGPCFGIKGGAAGGGYSQVVPMEDLNLHFTGDFHAITSANNLLAAMLDNHIQQGNELGIDPRQVVWKRCLDMNDRVLRNIVVGLGSKMDGMVREDHFVITVASEIMAVLCLADDMEDLKRRLGRMIVAYSFEGKPVTADDLHATGAMAALLKDALKPNLVQTLEHTPAIVHGGPFANIAHGCNSVRATKTAMKLADITITEAGFGADLGAEKFFDIKCRMAGLKPDAVVLVATVRALKYNGGVAKADLAQENLDAVKAGIVNLEKHIENLQKFGVPVVVTLNAFATDTQAELDYVEQFCKERGCEFAISEVWEKGGEGGIALAEKVLDAHKDEAIYYHTDHHWTSLGAWYAFQGAKTQLGLDKSEEIKMKAYAVSDSFNGTLSAKSGYETDYKEPIYIYLPKSADAPQVAVNYVEEQKKSASMYDSSKLDERDQYSVFFGGNHAMIDIQSTQTEKRRLLVFKDSYANCFLPLLAPYYREIVVIDPRYYTGKLSSVMSDKQFDDVLFLYNANTFFEDRMLAGVLDEN